MGSKQIDQHSRWFDKQFLFYIVQNLFIAVCGLVDTGFGNHIDLDSVCVLSSYTIITWITYTVYSVSSFVYRIFLDKAKTGFYLQTLTGVLLGVAVYCLSSLIPHIYSMTDTQNILFEKCLKAHAINLPIIAIGEFLGNYAAYNCKNKIAFTGNIILYGLMIITDAVVVSSEMGLVWLIRFTGVCYFAYSVYMYIALRFWKQKFKFNLSDIVMYLKHGVNICIDGLASRFAIIVAAIFASKLGTELYSIHSVCYAVQVFAECFTEALGTYQIVSLAKFPSGCDKFARCKSITKKYALFIIAAAYVSSYIMLFFTHGVVELKSCIPYMLLYGLQAIALLFYETMTAYLSSEHQTKYLKFGGICGIIVRIPIVIVGYYLNLGLIPFSVVCAIDWGIRGLFYYLVIRRLRRQ